MEKNQFNRFKNQVAIITGGADGIGKAISLRLALEGAQVVIFDINEKKLADIKEQFSASQWKCSTLVVDIANEQSVQQAMAKTYAAYGKIDVVINSAGIVGPTGTSITDYSFDSFQQVCQINLFGAFLVAKYALKYMAKEQYGRLLLIASIAGKEGNPNMAGYSASKSGVIGLVKGLGKEFAEKGITVNGLAPAVVKTAMNEDTAPEQLAYMTEKIPMKRLGTVEEVAAIATFIVSPENSFSTGFIYDISGGRATY